MPEFFNVQDKSIHILTKKEWVGDADSRGPEIWKAWAMEHEGIHAYGKTKEEAIAAAKETAESLYEFIPSHEGPTKSRETTSLSILRGTFGCPSGDHAEVDPYWYADDWHEAARGDGMSYSGVLETMKRVKVQKWENPHEDEWEPWNEFYARAQKRASELNAELDCSRCR